MALQVWLPLNGNLENNGLSNMAISGVGTVTYDSAGKIGSCFISGGSSQVTNGININSNLVDLLNGSNGSSIAVWVKPVGTHYHYNGTFISSGNWNNKCWAFGVSQDNTKVDVLCDGYNTFINCSVPVNTWTHLVCTYKDGVSKLYKNGTYVGELTGRSSFKSDASNTCIGRETYASGYFGFNGRINDVRIYDHCLSPKEVKEISKGLVLHYKLDDPYVEATTNLITSIGNTVRCSKEGNGIRIDWTQSANQGDTYFIFNTSEAIQQNTQYTLSFDVIGFTGTNVRFDWSNIHDSQYQCYIKEGRNTVAFTTGTIVTSFFDDYIRDNTSNFWMGNFQLEKKDHATPYTPSSRASSTVYDCSGYGRNGVITGSLNVDSDTPRYNKSTNFNGTSSRITAPFNYLYYGNNFTISAWVKSNVNSGGYLSAMGTELSSGGIVFGELTSTNRIQCYLNSTTGSDICTCSYTSFEANKWFHLVYSVSNALSSPSAILYINGVQVSTNSSSYVFGEPDQPIYIGCTSYGNLTPYRYWNGKISDVRIYTTTLSADDVKELYNTSAYIYNDGTVAAMEFDETSEGVSQINKTGVFDSGYFIENETNVKTLSDGSVWLRLLHHNNPASYLFTSSNCWDYDDDTNLYSKLGLMKSSNFANSSGEYEFLVCEKITSSASENQFRWKQTSNPATSSTITGYAAISGSPSYSGGLKTNGAYGAMHNGNTWWCCCASYTPYNGGIPGFWGIVTTGYLDLYVRIVGPQARGIDDLARIYSNTVSGNTFIEI